MKRFEISGVGIGVSGLCLGVMPWGNEEREAAADKLYEMFRAAGGNFFDTAHCYSFWESGGLGVPERRLGARVRKYGDVGKVAIATKGGHPAGGTAYPRPERYLSPEVIAGDVRESLERLGLERIELYYLHRDDLRVPVGEIVDALNTHVKRGELLALGASNWRWERIAAANEYAARKGLKGFVANQPQWNLAEPPEKFGDPTMRFLTAEDFAFHERTGLLCVPYSPTAGGYFASDGKRGVVFENAVSRARLGRVKELAGKLGCSANQVALAWLMHQPFPVVPILGTNDLEHLRDGIGAIEVKLTEAEVKWLRDG